MSDSLRPCVQLQEIQLQDLCSFAWADVKEVRGSPGKGLVLPSYGFSGSETILVWESHCTERNLDPKRNLAASRGWGGHRRPGPIPDFPDPGLIH